VLIFLLRLLIQVFVRFNNTTNERTFLGHLFGALFWIAVASIRQSVVNTTITPSSTIFA